MTNDQIPVVILCGGQGARLREETEYRPKPMVEVGGHPIIWHIMKIYGAAGFKKFILCLGYKGHLIKEYFMHHRSLTNDFTVNLGKKGGISYHGREEDDFEVTLADTGLDTMTGARLKRIENYIDTDTFMVTYGDGLIDLDIDDLLAFHRSAGTTATVTAVQPVSRFGVLEFNDGKRVTSFKEKPQVRGWTSAGFFVFNRKVFDYLSTDEDCVLEQEPLINLANDGELSAFPHNGFFFAMDTYREYLQLNSMWRSQSAPWRKW